MSGACPELASSPDDRDPSAGEVHRGVDPAVPGADRTAVHMRLAMAYAMEGLLKALGRFQETDEEYLARVAPYLDNEGRARVQEALSERLTKGGIAVPPGGDS